MVQSVQSVERLADIVQFPVPSRQVQSPADNVQKYTIVCCAVPSVVPSLLSAQCSAQ